jgi:hypothetical protein
MAASTNDSGKRIQSQANSTSQPPKKRFRIEKLEERIAPKKPGGGGQTSSGGVSIFGSIY